jgi:Ion channel
MMILPAAAGIIIILVVLWEAFETIVLPRRVTRRWRLTRAYYRSTWYPWRTLAGAIPSIKQRETMLSFYGPLSMLMLFVVWATLLVLGFGLVYYSVTRADSTHPTLATCFYLSGTTIFTLGIGDVTPHTPFERVLTVVESGLGFGFLALVLSYLPVIYQGFSRREATIVLLDARAGSPPSAAELLRRHADQIGLDALEELLRDWEIWSAQILESHISYPVLCYFRSQHSNESWLGALAAMLDCCALLLSGLEGACARQAKLTFAICRHTVVDLAQIFSAAPRPGANRLPAGDLKRMRVALTEAGLKLRDDEYSNKKLATLREMYEPYLQSLAEYLLMPLPNWILAKEITDNWRTTAWGRITGLTAPSEHDAAHDDHD